MFQTQGQMISIKAEIIYHVKMMLVHEKGKQEAG